MTHEHPICFFAAIGGVIGLLVALAIALSGPHPSLSPVLLLTLWPASILGFGYNGSNGFTPMSIVMPIVVLGGNAFVYAVVASILTGSVLGIKSLFTKKDRRPLSIKPD